MYRSRKLQCSSCFRTTTCISLLYWILRTSVVLRIECWTRIQETWIQILKQSGKNYYVVVHLIHSLNISSASKTLRVSINLKGLDSIQEKRGRIDKTHRTKHLDSHCYPPSTHIDMDDGCWGGGRGDGFLVLLWWGPVFSFSFKHSFLLIFNFFCYDICTTYISCVISCYLLTLDLLCIWKTACSSLTW